MNELLHTKHVAQIRVHLIGDSFTDLFYSGLEQLNEMLLPAACDKEVPSTITRTLSVQANNLPALFEKFLNALLEYAHQEQLIFCELQAKQIANDLFVGSLTGRRVAAFDKNIVGISISKSGIRLTPTSQLETIIKFDLG